MVQKRVLVLQTDHVKFNKLLKNLKPSSSSSSSFQQHQESDMMKIMIKQRQNLYSPTFKKQISQPGKPPTTSTSMAASKMQSLINISEKKPNYMKPTTSSDARKDNSQEYFKKNGKSTSKSVSALTKTTSFKPTRSAATKKSYPFVETIQKPTCSSTLKDSKFPDFLTLNSGGTESEGTSIMKVCTYTYCSLNGHHHHHHPPLPPLKSFMSARRHILKTERSMKMESLSPRRSREHRDVIVEDIETLQDEFLNKEDDDFFIQIYTKESEATADRVEIVQELESAPLTDTDTNHSDTDSAEDYSLEENLNENDAIEFFEPEINTMEGVENQEDEEKVTENNMEDIQGSSPFDSGLHLDDHNPDEIEHKYMEELKVDEVIEESFDEETITCLDANSDQDLVIDETNDSDVYQYDEIDNTKIMKIEVDNEDVVITEDDNQELKKDCAVDDNYCPSDQISETKDDNQEVKEDGAIGDHYALSEQKSESENDNQEVQNQSSIDDHYQTSDQKSESEEDNQELMKDIAIDGQYQQTDENSEIDSIETDKMDVSQSDLTGKNSLEFQNMHTMDFDEELSKLCKTGKWIHKQKESITEENDLKGFNPRGPNFLELDPDPESEKVDLKHQMIDDRRNSEEWMLDYALQQAVNKLAVARKKKVTLLVEAFETVSPLPKWEKKRMGIGFDLQHRIQACR